MRWNDLYNKCESNERRILNRALFSRIIIDEDEDVSFKHRESVKSALNQPTSHDPGSLGVEMKTPRYQTGQVSIFSTYVDLAGGMSKLSPALVRMSYEHRSIRQRQLLISSERHTTNQISKPTNAQLARAEAAYLQGSSLKVVAKQVGIGHERLVFSRAFR